MPQAKVLMMLLQMHWKPDKPVDYGIREASEKIPCDPKTASKAFNQLQERGFIFCTDESLFSSRTQSKTRTWRLEWLPFKDNSPRNTWENLESKNKPTVGNMTALVQSQRWYFPLWLFSCYSERWYFPHWINKNNRLQKSQRGDIYHTPTYTTTTINNLTTRRTVLIIGQVKRIIKTN